MAVRSDRGGGPGTYESGGVKCTLDAPFAKASKGTQGTMPAPFNAPRAGGDNGLPTKTFDTSMGGPKSTPKPGTNLTSPSQQGPARTGQR